MACRYNTFLDVKECSGSITFNHGDVEPDEVDPKHSCALDVAESSEGASLEYLGLVLNVSRERVRQIVETTLTRVKKVRAEGVSLSDLVENPERGVARQVSVMSTPTRKPKAEPSDEEEETVDVPATRVETYVDEDGLTWQHFPEHQRGPRGPKGIGYSVSIPRPLSAALIEDGNHDGRSGAEDACFRVWTLYWKGSVENGFTRDVNAQGKERRRRPLPESLLAIQPRVESRQEQTCEQTTNPSPPSTTSSGAANGERKPLMERISDTALLRTRILQMMQESPDASQREIGEKLGISQMSVSRHQRALRADGSIGPTWTRSVVKKEPELTGKAKSGRAGGRASAKKRRVSSKPSEPRSKTPLLAALKEKECELEEQLGSLRKVIKMLEGKE